MIVRKGDIFYADLSGYQGCEQGGTRPVIVIQNNLGNKHSPTTIVAVITSKDKRKEQKTHVVLNDDCGLEEKSLVMLEQIRTLDKRRLKEKVGRCNSDTFSKINKAICVSFFLTDRDYEE